MNIKQFRDVLENAAVTHARLNADDSAKALRALAAVLESHEKWTVQRLVAEVKKLRKTTRAKISRSRESA
jgi:hypothetical protein